MTKKTTTKTTSEVEIDNRSYELMLVLVPDMLESRMKKKLKDLSKYIEDNGGKIIHEDIWGKQKLAYNIKKHEEGIYVVYNMELPSTFLQELNQHLRLDTEVIRYMTVSLAADYTYSKYDEEDTEEEKPKSRKPKIAPIKKEPIITPVKEKIEEKPVEKKAKEETKEEIKEDPSVSSEVPKKEEAPKPKADKEEGKEPDEAKLDAKLDEIIGGDDLNL